MREDDEKEGCSFLKERTKELFPVFRICHHLTGKVFLLLFLQKKKALPSRYFIGVHDTL